MFRKWTVAVAVLSGVLGTSHAETYPGGPRYDGTVKITALTGTTCATLSDTVGDVHIAIFRSQNPAGSPEAMSVFVPNGILWMIAELDGTFAGNNQVASGTLIIDAFRGVLPDAVFDLRFEPSVVDPALVTSFKFRGKWRNYKVNGCTASVRARFNKRP